MVRASRRRLQTAAWVLLTILLLFCFTLPVLAYDIPGPTKNFYVNDFADLLSEESKSYIMSINKDLQDQTKAQVVVVTIESLDGADLEEYATDLFRQYGIGDKDEDNGVLILLSHEDRKVRIEVGYGLEGTINDAKAGRILDNYMVPYLSEDKWDEGICNGFDAVIQEIKTEYGVDVRSNVPTEFETEEDDDWIFGAFLIAGISALVGFVLGMISEDLAIYAIPVWIIIVVVYVFLHNGFGDAVASVVEALLGYMLGWGLTISDSGSSSGSGGYYRSSGGSSSGGYSGGGGSSGGGGASRGF